MPPMMGNHGEFGLRVDQKKGVEAPAKTHARLSLIK